MSVHQKISIKKTIQTFYYSWTKEGSLYWLCIINTLALVSKTIQFHIQHLEPNYSGLFIHSWIGPRVSLRLAIVLPTIATVATVTWEQPPSALIILSSSILSLLFFFKSHHVTQIWSVAVSDVSDTERRWLDFQGNVGTRKINCVTVRRNIDSSPSMHLDQSVHISHWRDW